MGGRLGPPKNFGMAPPMRRVAGKSDVGRERKCMGDRWVGLWEKKYSMLLTSQHRKKAGTRRLTSANLHLKC